MDRVRFGIISVFLLITAGCAQTGDFGRATQAPGFNLGTVSSNNDEELRTLTLTDEEREMQNRIHRFVSFAHNQDWVGNVMQTVRSQSGRRPEQSDYYTWLRGQNYASSAGPYRKILNDVQLDLLTLPGVFASICAVFETDRRRSVAVSGLSQPDPEIVAGLTARRFENNQAVAGFVEALAFRYESYSYALEHLLVDAPLEEARSVDAKLSELAGNLENARANRFCRSS